MSTETETRNTQYAPREVKPVDQARCDDCPPDRVCAWDCEQGQGVLEILMGEALADQAKLNWPDSQDVEPEQTLYEIYT